MAKTYSVYRDGEVVASNLTTKSYTDTELSPATSYSYAVSATNEHGESEKSEEITVETDEPHEPPESPEELQATGQTDTTADLEWQ